MARILGLDIGIGSIGWAMVDTEDIDRTTGEIDERFEVAGCGARCFEVPEEPDTKELRNKGRRLARGQRRVTRRRRQRLREIRRLLARGGLPVAGEIEAGAPSDLTWQLRREALDRALSGEEWARVLLHLAKHRGFKSLSKREALDNKSDAGKALQGIAQLQQAAAGYRTLGEALAVDPRFATRKRNTAGDYSHTALRADVEREAARLFAEQRRMGNPAAGAELERRYMEIAFRQLPLRSSLEMVGRCRFEPAEHRAPRNAPSFERFRFLQTLNHLRIHESGSGPRALSAGERERALPLFGTVQKPTYKALRKRLGLAEGTRFEGLAATKDPESKPLGDFTGSVKLQEALGPARFAALLQNDPAALDAAMAAIVFQSADEQVEAELRGTGLSDAEVDAVLGHLDRFAGLRGAGHVSALACRRLLPHLEAGQVYSEACRLAGYDHTALGQIDLKGLPNPVVRKVIGECLKQVRVLFREFGMPDRVHVEMARDLGKSREDRQEIYRAGQERGAERDRHRDQYEELIGRRPNDEELMRYELWLEQDHRCLYTGDYISPAQLRATDNSIQIDHILPYSRSGDDSFRNKALVTAKANQDKRDRSLWEWFGESDAKRWQELETRVDLLRKASGLHKEKVRKLLLKSFAEREEAYRARHLQDTRYIIRVFRLLLEQHWPALRTRADEERRIFTQPGALTALVRRGLGLDEAKRGGRLGDRDHALDAMVVAWTSPAVVKRLTDGAKVLELQARARLVPELVAEPQEKERLRQAILAAAEGVFVSRPESRRGRGPAHGDTLYAFTPNGDGSVTRFQRVAVTKLERKHLERLKDPERSRALKAAAEAWLTNAERLGFKPGKLEKFAAQHPLCMPTRNGGSGPAVGHLTIQLPDRVKGGMTVQRGESEGHVDVATMVRVDVFAKNGKFYLIPIYAWQIADRARWPRPPARAIVAFKAEPEWISVDASFEFKFSLFSGSYIEMEHRSGEVFQGYFRSADRSTAQTTFSAPSEYDSKRQQRAATKTLSSFRKFHVDRLGNRFEIVREPRLWHGEVCS
ncbi:MAG: type II CRISPR RNA-guided endonuclease Cas9 [Geminicoccaceae bacterium]